MSRTPLLVFTLAVGIALGVGGTVLVSSEPTPSEATEQWVEAGFDRDVALQIVSLERAGVRFPAGGAAVAPGAATAPTRPSRSPPRAEPPPARWRAMVME